MASTADTLDLAETIAHELGHQFGLDHKEAADVPDVSYDEGLILDAAIVSHGGRLGGGFMRFDFRQNDYEVLAESVGLRPAAPAYVSGTGAHDVITIGGSVPIPGLAQVTVKAYRDAAHNELITIGEGPDARPAVARYYVPTENGILVEALQRNDHVIVRPTAGADVHLRGGSGSDVLRRGLGDDVLEGGRGNDTLAGGYGNDTYVFSAVPFTAWTSNRLGSDRIWETGHETDTLDFSNSAFGVTIDLASTRSQKAHTDLKLTLNRGDLIENVIGSERADHISGNRLANEIHGRGGNDEIRGGDGNDRLYGEMGRDILFGEGDRDWLRGGRDGQRDSLIGGRGRDRFVRAESEALRDFNWALDTIVRELTRNRRREYRVNPTVVNRFWRSSE